MTDHQFSTVALLDNAANLVERVTYDAYGMARHHWAADLTGDGAVDSADRSLALAAHNTSIGDSAYNVDADMSRTGTVVTGDLHWFGTSQFKAALPMGDLSVRSIGNTIGYCGYVFNPEVPSTNGGGGFYTVRFRHYDAEFGRWLERDPLGYVDGMNLYEYVQGNAVNAFDPFGLCGNWNFDPPKEELPIESPVAPSGGGGAPLDVDRGSTWDPLQEFLEDRSQAATGMRETLEEAGTVVVAITAEVAWWLLPTGAVVNIAGKIFKVVLKGGKKTLAKVANSTFQYGNKIAKQMKLRGWTDNMIDEAISAGQQIPATNKATGNAATRYVHPRTGQSVVVDDVTGEVIHVGGPGFKYGPASGDVP